MLWWCCGTEDSPGKSTFLSLNSAQEDPHSETTLYHQPVLPQFDEMDEGTTKNTKKHQLASPAFWVDLERGNADSALGLHLDLCDGKVLHVCGLRQGVPSPVVAYNASVPEDKRLLPGDYIKAVNGISSTSVALAEELKRHPALQLLVQRPYCFVKRIERKLEPMGLDLNYSDRGASLVIMEIGTGAVKRLAPEIRVGDRIVSVNGMSGSPLHLLDMIKDTQTLELGVSRCPQCD
mmetsp:Transcript_127878/g.319229  ORF Transcript_127878/g.319229 Transcript_127878/m.319229 type:complete len:235 (+) Transcript_127878:103-807(+)